MQASDSRACIPIYHHVLPTSHWRKDQIKILLDLVFRGGSDGKEPAMQKTQVQSLGRENPLEKGKAIHSSILAWGIPWTGRLQSMGSQTAGQVERLTVNNIKL